MFSGTFNPVQILGLSNLKTLTPSEIKKAYYQKALIFHPDKPGGSEKAMKDINKAYDILTNPIARGEWEESQKSGEEKNDTDESILELNSTAERPSANYRRHFAEIEKHFKQSPLSPISEEKRKEVLSRTHVSENKPFYTHYQNLYRAKEDGLEFPDVFQLVSHLNKWASKTRILKDTFLKSKLSPKKAILILLDFLQGFYYGKTLTTVQEYMEKETSQLYQFNNPDVILYKAITAILSVKNIKTENAALLTAIDNIYSATYGGETLEQDYMIRLLASKHFRHFVISTLKHFWQSSNPIVTENLINELNSEHERLKKILPLGATLFRIEKKLKSVFSNPAELENIYEAGYLLIDLSETCITSVSRVNSLILAGLCFQLAAKKEEKTRAMTAERLSLTLYQKALHQAFHSTAALTLYTTTHVIKYLAEFIYEQGTPNYHILTDVIQPGDAEVNKHSGTVLETIENSIKRALYLVDTLPFYTSLKTTLDLEVLHIHQTGLIRQLLNDLTQKNSPDHVLSNVLYHAYEEAIRHYSQTEDKIIHLEKIHQFKLRAIESLLQDEKQNLNDMAELVDVPYIHMGRDKEGWLTPINELDFPDKTGVPIYKSFDGYQINQDSGEIKLLYKEWKSGDPESQRLFTGFDLLQMFKIGIDGGFFSLDHADPYKKYHPLQQVRFSPSYLIKTEFLKTLFMTDYLLKMFTTGVEISANPPYLTRNSQKLIERLPERLKKIINRVVDEKERPSRAHRFWISLENIERLEETKGATTTTYFGNVTATINQHLLELNEKGELVDAKKNVDDNSAEATFAREMTAAYDEISDYFPEFRRLKELVKITGAIADLKRIRELNKNEIQKITLSLADNKTFNKIHADVYNKKITLLQEQQATFPKFTYQLHDPEVSKTYQELYQQNYTRIKQSIYNDNYEENKKNITAQHGQSRWLQEEAKISQELLTYAETETRKILDAKLSQHNILAQLNEGGQKNRNEIKQTFHTIFLSLKPYINNYDAAIEAFMNKNA
ncbi:MAG: DnaJ domain-containing protein, partial [Gammaproteobacteria bacterium]|nr:DnaJ domain-containing protein [Gammaproteobacteria bacterium]